MIVAFIGIKLNVSLSKVTLAKYLIHLFYMVNLFSVEILFLCSLADALSSLFTHRFRYSCVVSKEEYVIYVMNTVLHLPFSVSFRFLKMRFLTTSTSKDSGGDTSYIIDGSVN